MRYIKTTDIKNWGVVLMYFDEIPRYRDTIMESICKCNSITNLIRSEETPEMKVSEMPYKFIYPYGYIINKTTSVGTYLCFDLFAPRTIGRTFTDFRIDFWIMAHERRMRTSKGLVTDLLTTEVDKLINGSRCFGLGRVELMTWDRFVPAEDFYGRILSYRTVDFNRE